MSTPNRKRMKLTEMRDQAIDTLGVEPGIELELSGGAIVFVPNPVLAPDDATEALADNRIADAAKLILGEKEHAKLLSHGGNSNDVVLAWRVMQQDLNLDQKSDD